MSLHFHPLKIKEIKKETPDCVSVLFEIPDDLRETFSFKQGQSLTMRTFLNGKEVRRTYSISSSPLDSEWQVAIKQQDAGLFSTFANQQLKKDDILEVMPPVGKFYVELNPKNNKKYIAFVAGSGITPVISIIKTTLRAEPSSEFTLVYGNRSRSSIIFFEELEALKNKFLERFNLIHVLSRERIEIPINFGKINNEKLNELGKLIDYSLINEFFICGPEEMIFCVRDFLQQKGISEKKIHFELFTTAGTGQKVKSLPDGQAGKKGKNKPELEGAKSRIIIKLDGRSFEFDLPMNSETVILDAALKQGADLPYACKGGMCCTCKARLIEGEVDMDVYWGLEEEEINQGYILTCQAHPKTEKVVVDYDIR